MEPYPPSDIRVDPLTDGIAIVPPGRDKRPQTEEEYCPFCWTDGVPPSNAIIHLQDGGVAVVALPNKFAAMRIEGEPHPVHMHHRVAQEHRKVRGAHELVVPNVHDRTFATLGVPTLRLMLEALRTRTANLYHDLPEVKHVQAWGNFGAKAGASKLHPHLQLMALPIDLGRDRVLRAEEYYNSNLESIFAAMLSEATEDHLVVDDMGDICSFCPHVSQQPHTIRIIPRLPWQNLGAIHDLFGLATIMDRSFRRLSAVYNGTLPDLNMVFHESPSNAAGGIYTHYRFQIEIIPRINTPAGLEMSHAGIYINSRSPEDAAKELRNAVI